MTQEPVELEPRETVTMIKELAEAYRQLESYGKGKAATKAARAAILDIIEGLALGTSEARKEPILDQS